MTDLEKRYFNRSFGLAIDVLELLAEKYECQPVDLLPLSLVKKLEETFGVEMKKPRIFSNG